MRALLLAVAVAAAGCSSPRVAAPARRHQPRRVVPTGPPQPAEPLRRIDGAAWSIAFPPADATSMRWSATLDGSDRRSGSPLVTVRMRGRGRQPVLVEVAQDLSERFVAATPLPGETEWLRCDGALASDRGRWWFVPSPSERRTEVRFDGWVAPDAGWIVPLGTAHLCDIAGTVVRTLHDVHDDAYVADDGSVVVSLPRPSSRMRDEGAASSLRWTGAGGELVADVPMATDAIDAAALAPDGSLFVIHREGVLIAHDRAGREAWRSELPGAPAFLSIAIADAGAAVTVHGHESGRSVRVLGAGGVPIPLEGRVDHAGSAALSHDGSRVAIVSDDGSAHVHELPAGRRLRALPPVPPARLGMRTEAALDGSGRTLALLSEACRNEPGRGYASDCVSDLRVLDVDSGRDRGTWRFETGFDILSGRVVLADDGRWVLLEGRDALALIEVLR